MASVFKKTVTRPLPGGAELFCRKGQQFARWKDRKGKPRTAPVTIGKDGSLRISTEASTYTAKYRDGEGILKETATGCRDKTAALAVLRELTCRAEKVKSGLISAADNEAIDYQNIAVNVVLEDYVRHLTAKGCSSAHVADCVRLTKRACTGCGFTRLRKISWNPLEEWLIQLSETGSSPRTRNSYLQAVRGFCRWCMSTGRLQADPTRRIAKAGRVI